MQSILRSLLIFVKLCVIIPKYVRKNIKKGDFKL